LEEDETAQILPTNTGILPNASLYMLVLLEELGWIE
jgi:hypothetical protein